MAHSADRPFGSMDTVTHGRARSGESGVFVTSRVRSIEVLDATSLPGPF